MNLEVTLAGKTFKNPVTTASGTFGSGAEYEQFVDLWWNAECCRTSESGNRFIL